MSDAGTDQGAAPRDVGAALSAIGRWQPVTNAFSQIWADEAGAATPPDGPLSGIPVAVKDLFDVAGHETTGCCAAYEGRIADTDATVVTRLREAGAVIVGKTNQHELAMGATNLISACGPTANPHDPERITGGSSGGSGAAVASGCVPMALGTDTGGSIRIPASLCGTWGLKPGHGVVPVDGVMPLAASIDCPGPMTQTAADLALLWSVMASADHVSAPGVPPRVGLLGGYFASRLHLDERAALARTVRHLRTEGVEVVDIDGGGLIDQAAGAWVDLVCDEMAAHYPDLRAKRELLNPRTAGFIAKGMNTTDEQRTATDRTVLGVEDWFARRLDGVDLLLAPTTPYPAPLASEEDVEVGPGERVDVKMGGTSIFTRPVSLSRLPALAVPSGPGPATGLPCSVQFIAPAGGEDVLIALALALEADGLGSTSVPPVPDPWR